LVVVEVVVEVTPLLPTILKLGVKSWHYRWCWRRHTFIPMHNWCRFSVPLAY